MKVRALILAIFACAIAYAQNGTTYGTITAGSTTCTPTSCVYYQIPPNTPWVSIAITGNWNGTLQVQAINSPSATYQNLNSQTWSLISTNTANTNVSVAVGSATFLLVQSPLLINGAANVQLTASLSGSPLINPAFSGMEITNGLQAPNGGNSTDCWNTNGSFSTCTGSVAATLYLLNPVTYITNSQFAVGCSTPADPTGTNDSACEVKNAIAYIEANATSDTGYQLHFPGGHWKVGTDNTPIVLPNWLNVTCDGLNTTVIQSVAATANLFTVYSTTSLGTLLTNKGSINNCILEGNGHLGTGTLLELDSADGYGLNHVALKNGGGRGLVLNGSSERGVYGDLEIDWVRYPVNNYHNANEQHGFKINIDSPGQDESGYCWGTNCANGVPPNVYATVSTLISAVSTGTSVTTVLSGNSGISPVAVGHHFQLAGTTGVVLDGVYTVTSVANNTASGQFTVVGVPSPLSRAQIVASITGSPLTVPTGTATVSGATWKIGLLPQIHCGIWAEGVNVAFNSGSEKSTYYACGLQSIGSEDQNLDQFYLEGFNGNAVSPAAYVGGIPPMTTLAATMSTTTGPVAVTDTSWIQPFISDPIIAAATASPSPYVIMPQDGFNGSSTTSTYFPSVTQGTQEFVSGYVSGDGNFHATARGCNSGGGNCTGTTYAWPAGSILEFVPGVSYGSGLKLSESHLESTEPPYLNNSVAACICIPGVTPSGEVVVGLFQDDLLNSSSGTGASTTQFATIDYNSFYGNTYSNIPEGQGTIRVVGNSQIQLLDISGPLFNGETPEVAIGQMTNQGPPGVLGTQYPGGKIVNPNFNRPASSQVMTPTPNNTQYNNAWLAEIGGNGAANVGPNPGFNFAAQGWQYTGSVCNWDVGNPIATTTASGILGANFITVASATNIAAGQYIVAPQIAVNTVVGSSYTSGSTTVPLSTGVVQYAMSGQSTTFSNPHAQHRMCLLGGPNYNTAQGGLFLYNFNNTANSWTTLDYLGDTLASFGTNIVTTGNVAAATSSTTGNASVGGNLTVTGSISAGSEIDNGMLVIDSPALFNSGYMVPYVSINGVSATIASASQDVYLANTSNSSITITMPTCSSSNLDERHTIWNVTTGSAMPSVLAASPIILAAPSGNSFQINGHITGSSIVTSFIIPGGAYYETHCTNGLDGAYEWQTATSGAVSQASIALDSSQSGSVTQIGAPDELGGSFTLVLSSAASAHATIAEVSWQSNVDRAWPQACWAATQGSSGATLSTSAVTGSGFTIYAPAGLSGTTVVNYGCTR